MPLSLGHCPVFTGRPWLRALRFAYSGSNPCTGSETITSPASRLPGFHTEMQYILDV